MCAQRIPGSKVKCLSLKQNSMRPAIKNPKSKIQNPKPNGVALVAVLAVLVVLAVLASSFAVLMSMERRSSQVMTDKLNADLFAKSGFEHALSHLWLDSVAQPGWDCLNESWNKTFKPFENKLDDATDVDRLTNLKRGGNPHDARWFYVYDNDGAVIGRYAVLVEDESGKINVNTATGLSEKQQNEGAGVFENLLTDGKKRGLPFSINFAKNILRHRYGRDLAPGQRNIDDNLTEAAYATDEIDNNANGIVDEKDEGIDEQEEYSSINPRWDDRAFQSVNDVVNLCAKEKSKSLTPYRYLNKFATINSKSTEMYWDDETKKFFPRVNLNVATKKQIQRIFSRANSEETFTSAGKNLRRLVANTVDYRDENHVLTTVGSEYGVEAVCFNEVMANEGSYTMEVGNPFQPAGPHAYPEKHIHSFIYVYSIWYDMKDKHIKYGWPIDKLGSPGGRPMDVITNGVPVKMPHTTTVKLDRDMSQVIRNQFYRNFQKIRKANGYSFPDDLWKNAWLKIIDELDGNNAKSYIYYPIVGNNGDELTIGYDDNAENSYQKLQDTKDDKKKNSVRIDNLWKIDIGDWCVFPEVSSSWIFPTEYSPDFKPKDNLYYYIYIGDQSFPGDINTWGLYPFKNNTRSPWKGYNRFMDVDGKPSSHSRSEIISIKKKDLIGTTMEIPDGKNKMDMLRWAYKDGKPIKAKNGFLRVNLTSCKDTGYVGGMNKTDDFDAFSKKNCFDIVYIMRPDVVELINISDKPISMRNWKVVINTGSYADQVGLIENAFHYSFAKHGKFNDPNPTIPPKGYFYLTNKRSIFAAEYGGSGSDNWGAKRSQEYPCFELPDILWGVRYKITSVNLDRVSVMGAKWKNDQMKYEMIEIHSKTSFKDRNSPTGIRQGIHKSGRDWLDVQPLGDWRIQLEVNGVRAGDDLLILGMPREGGFLSMTLKNEYEQIVARTIEYGSVKPEEQNYSTEKIDPTHYKWLKSKRPTFGGNERKAQNHSNQKSSLSMPHIKNNRYTSPGEIQKVRSAGNWENIGGGNGNSKALKSIGNYFTVSGIRLDPEEKDAHIKGWRKAFGEAAQFKADIAVAENANWEPGIWEGQTLRILSGNLKGEKFPIIKSTENSVRIDGYSTPSGKKMRVQKGDKFSVGPGYSTAMFYSRRDNDEGIWEWKNQNLEKRKYGLYLFGLNDSIETTEFLEENFNAKLNVSIYNFEKNCYDQLPLLSECSKKVGRKNLYGQTKSGGNFQYEKNDGLFCGTILPQHISSKKGIKLKIVPHGLEGKKGSGFAWFDYAYLAPGTVCGKININTASPRILSSLPGISPNLAKNILKGSGKIRQYKKITDILDAKGFSTEIYGKICNLITTRSDQFRIQVFAEALKDVNNDGKFNSKNGDEILAQARIDKIVDRSQLTDNNPETQRFLILK